MWNQNKYGGAVNNLKPFSLDAKTNMAEVRTSLNLTWTYYFKDGYQRPIFKFFKLNFWIMR
jgi:hypothetical protein